MLKKKTLFLRDGSLCREIFLHRGPCEVGPRPAEKLLQMAKGKIGGEYLKRFPV